MLSPADREKAVELFNRHFNHLVLFVNQYTHSIPTAEDLVQDMFVRLLEKGQLLDSPPAYLFVCARNAARNYLRDRHEHVELAEAQAAASADPGIEETPSNACRRYTMPSVSCRHAATRSSAKSTTRTSTTTRWRQRWGSLSTPSRRTSTSPSRH